jgi:hypothetical protein
MLCDLFSFILLGCWRIMRFVAEFEWAESH